MFAYARCGYKFPANQLFAGFRVKTVLCGRLAIQNRPPQCSRMYSLPGYHFIGLERGTHRRLFTSLFCLANVIKPTLMPFNKFG